MATYFIVGEGNSLFTAYKSGGSQTLPAPLADRLLYVNANEFGFENADGSFTYVSGSGFSFNAATGQFTAGSVTAIRHYDATGTYVDDIKTLSAPVPVSELQAALEASAGGDTTALNDVLLSGSDHLNATYFAGMVAGVILDGFGGDDLVFGSVLADTLNGGADIDTIHGNDGADLIFGGAGNDIIAGGRGADSIYGDAMGMAVELGDDRIGGGGGKDFLDGGRGNDILRGGSGRDMLAGGITGDDQLSGGKGGDVFIFSFSGDDIRPVGGAHGNDTILDFEVGVDRLSLWDMLNRPMTFGNDADGNAVIRVDEANSITLVGIDANKVTLDELLAF